MGEMADYYNDEAENAWLREYGASTNMTYEEWLEHDAKVKLEIRSEQAEAAIKAVVRALRDGTYWPATSGKHIQINRLTKRHAQHIIQWLYNHAEGLHTWVCIGMIGQAPGNQETIAADDFDAAFDELNEMDPIDWIKEQPLIENLKVRANKRLVKVR